MSTVFRRASTVLVAATLLIVLAVAGTFLRVPYLVAAPGIALNTVGEREGEQVIQIDGHQNYEHEEGGLAMVTVQYSGGPGTRINLFTVLSAWLAPSQAVLPEEAIFPPDRSVDEVTESQNMQMDSSQQLAIAAALDQLDIDYEQIPLVAVVDENMPAAGLLESGDLILEVDGEAVDDQADVVREVRERTPGEPVDVTVRRDGQEEQVTIETTATESEEAGGEPEAIIGILLESEMEFPFDVDIRVGEIGGPSAGMMLALGTIDRLTEEDLTGGHFIAGSGTIEPHREEGSEETEWRIGAVSGVAQKMVSAERSGAEYFFVAEGSCSQTHESAAEDIDVVAIETLEEALDALELIRSGDSDELPRCE